ncbi:tetratricopeptide repeat protein [Pseudoduganella sp. SL102]|uniref:tetratricopeptide repeat protein n=1 Tax=Pseudoduganella sp. SL102 TaxID=2995154 RepID=UPI00248BF668|nr:tetratricopeptide repeat protein [Pseudoduganella sp. SL102]WBS02333.1 tetratricopeptide repeat protein [Pseudoduganella sp. SL102]
MSTCPLVSLPADLHADLHADPHADRPASLLRIALSALALLMAFLLSGCATAPAPEEAPGELFADHLFGPSTATLTEAEIFGLTPAMKAYVKEVQRHRRGREIRRALFEALYQRDGLQLEYDSALTRTAAQAFAARQGNCLSLVIMTAALASEMNIPVVFQDMPVDDAWSRSGDLYFNSGHVNLKLGRILRESVSSYDSATYMVVDFQPPPDRRPVEGNPISRQTVVAMFMNNRAAEALARDRFDEAYWWSRHAIVADPSLLYAYNTLAVVYRRHGNPAMAERTLRWALDREPKSTMVLNNLAQLLDAEGRKAEATVMRERLARLQPVTPFYYFNLGRTAMAMGDWQRARQLFERELQRDPDYHEFHAWLAAALRQLGDHRRADQHIKRAMATSTTRTDHALYAAKLDRLRAHAAPTPSH